MMDVFEHFQSSEETLVKIKNIVKDNGHICFKVPNKDSLLYRVARFGSYFSKSLASKLLWRMYQVDFPPPHYFYFNKSSLAKVIEKDFDLIESFYVSELPIKGMWQRLWGVPTILRLIIFPVAIIYSLIASGPLQDGLVIIAKKKS